MKPHDGDFGSVFALGWLAAGLAVAVLAPAQAQAQPQASCDCTVTQGNCFVVGDVTETGRRDQPDGAIIDYRILLEVAQPQDMCARVSYDLKASTKAGEQKAERFAIVRGTSKMSYGTVTLRGANNVELGLGSLLCRICGFGQDSPRAAAAAGGDPRQAVTLSNAAPPAPKVTAPQVSAPQVSVPEPAPAGNAAAGRSLADIVSQPPNPSDMPRSSVSPEARSMLAQGAGTPAVSSAAPSSASASAPPPPRVTAPPPPTVTAPTAKATPPQPARAAAPKPAASKPVTPKPVAPKPTAEAAAPQVVAPKVVAPPVPKITPPPAPKVTSPEPPPAQLAEKPNADAAAEPAEEQDGPAILGTWEGPYDIAFECERARGTATFEIERKTGPGTYAGTVHRTVERQLRPGCTLKQGYSTEAEYESPATFVVAGDWLEVRPQSSSADVGATTEVLAIQGDRLVAEYDCSTHACTAGRIRLERQ